MSSTRPSPIEKVTVIAPDHSRDNALDRARDRSPQTAQHPTSTRARLARALGLHPLVAFGMIAADWMMFGGEVGTGGVGLAVTIPVALALTLPCILIQRYSFGDAWGGAIGKGLMVGVLTAIPMPLGSALTLVGGVLGLLGPGKKALPAKTESGDTL